MVTVTEVVENVCRIVAENPDYVYQWNNPEVCTYTFEGKGDCLIGQALIMAGVPVETLAAIDQDDDTVGKYPDAYNVVKSFSDPINDAEEVLLNWLSTVQSFQDGGYTWGEAVAKADNRLFL